MISPYRRMGYGEMKRVTQFDIYLLGTVRCLSRVKAGDRIDAHRERIILSYIGLNGFSNNPVSVSSLPGSVKAAKDLLTQIGILEGEMGGQGFSKGIVSDSMYDFLARLMHEFEAILRHEMSLMPTYVIEKTGIYNADDLLEHADNAFLVSLKSKIPTQVLDDFRKAGACLGFDLYTACGFHAFRAVDGMLRCYHDAFPATSSMKKPQPRDWNGLITNLRGVIGDPVASPKPNLRTVELLDKIRSMDRNPVIHPEVDLDAETALTSFEVSKLVIEYMAIDI